VTTEKIQSDDEELFKIVITMKV